MGFREFIRQFDGFSRPIMLSYKNELKHTSACGGVVTIILGLVLLAYLIQAAVIDIFLQPLFAETAHCEYKGYFGNNNETFRLDAIQYNLAMLVQGFYIMEDDVHSLVRVQYFTIHRDNSSEPI